MAKSAQAEVPDLRAVDRVYQRDVLESARRRVARNGGAPGVDPWDDLDGIRRGVLSQSIRDFASLQSTLDWLDEQAWWSRLWTSDGLVIEWARVPSRWQLSVNIWKVLVRGAKPSQMPGASDDAIRLPLGSG